MFSVFFFLCKSKLQSNVCVSTDSFYPRVKKQTKKKDVNKQLCTLKWINFLAVRKRLRCLTNKRHDWELRESFHCFRSIWRDQSTVVHPDDKFRGARRFGTLSHTGESVLKTTVEEMPFWLVYIKDESVANVSCLGPGGPWEFCCFVFFCHTIIFSNVVWCDGAREWSSHRFGQNSLI